MPIANYFVPGDGLNTAGFQWYVEHPPGGANAAAGVSDFVNRQQINIKSRELSETCISGSWSYQPTICTLSPHAAFKRRKPAEDRSPDTDGTTTSLDNVDEARFAFDINPREDLLRQKAATPPLRQKQRMVLNGLQIKRTVIQQHSSLRCRNALLITYQRFRPEFGDTTPCTTITLSVGAGKTCTENLEQIPPHVPML